MRYLTLIFLTISILSFGQVHHTNFDALLEGTVVDTITLARVYSNVPNRHVFVWDSDRNHGYQKYMNSPNEFFGGFGEGDGGISNSQYLFKTIAVSVTDTTPSGDVFPACNTSWNGFSIGFDTCVCTDTFKFLNLQEPGDLYLYKNGQEVNHILLEPALQNSYGEFFNNEPYDSIEVSLNGPCAMEDFNYKIYSAPLPVTLTDFYYSNGYLYWTYWQSVNFSHFVVEQSHNSYDWVADKATRENYHLADFDFGSYFRLKMVDLDGSFEYSKIINVPQDEIDSIKYLYFNYLGQRVTADYRFAIKIPE